MDKIRIEIEVNGQVYGDVKCIDPSIDVEATAKTMVNKIRKTVLKNQIIRDIQHAHSVIESCNLTPRYLFIDEEHYAALNEHFSNSQPFGISKFQDLKVLVDDEIKGFSIGV